jgi:spectinomycin phosphotransferase
MQASIYKAEAHGQTYFVKIKRGHHPEIGIEVVELLHETGIREIIPPVKTIEGQLAKRLEEYTLIVYPFVEGENGFSRSLTDGQWIELGKALKQVHEMEIPPSIQSRVRKEDYSPRWREAVRSLYTQLEAKPIGEIALKLWNFMHKNKQTIHRLVDRAEELGRKAQALSPKFVLCHSDIHAGNLLMDENNTFYIVDWDEPILAPPERDLMFIGGGVGNVWNKPREIELFYQGYGKTEVNSILLAYHRHERIVEDIALYCQELLFKSVGNKDRLEMYHQFMGMFEPQGVVDMAFKTDTDYA